jgi:heptosyltransferase I
VKILIIKPSSLGDVVQALPVLRLLKRHLPASQIYWWIESSLAPLLEGDPDLAGVVRLERRGWAKPSNLRHLWETVRWARQQRFDWVIDLQSLLRSGALAWLANGELTVGLDEPREPARGFYDIIVRRPSFLTHAVDWYLQALSPLRVPVRWDFEWLPERPSVSAEVRRKWDAGANRWIALQPGARWPNKRWPTEHFAELLRQLLASHPQHHFAILGSRDDEPLGERLGEVGGGRCLNLTGKLSLPEMIEWIRLTDLMVSNDTGPMHVAAALGKPLIALFGPTEPRRTGPYHQLDHVLQLDLDCVPCLKSSCSHARPLECLRAIEPALVATRLRRMLAADSINTPF